MKERDEALDMFCTAIEMKEKKRALYEEAMKACPDQVGIETFQMLKDAEMDHLKRIQDLYEELRDGKDWEATCRFHEFHSEDKQALLRKIAEEHGKIPKACVDDLVAIETGLQLENASVSFFEDRLKIATNAAEREFLECMVAEEREHYILLADLKYYYADPESWFMEKSRARLDGAGGMT
jgi:rubrerythrin